MSDLLPRPQQPQDQQGPNAGNNVAPNAAPDLASNAAPNLSPPVMEAVKKMIDYMKAQLGPEKTAQVIMDMIEAQAKESGAPSNVTPEAVQQFINQPPRGNATGGENIGATNA